MYEKCNLGCGQQMSAQQAAHHVALAGASSIIDSGQLNGYFCHYIYGNCGITHSGFDSQEEADLSVANSLAGDKNFDLPKLKRRWFQVWLRKDYDYMQKMVSEIRGAHEEMK